MEFSSAERRLAGRGAFAVGLLHLLLPELLVDVVRFVYDVALDVSFVPRDRTAHRVRLLGAALVLGGIVLSASVDCGPNTVSRGRHRATTPMDPSTVRHA